MTQNQQPTSKKEEKEKKNCGLIIKKLFLRNIFYKEK